MYDPNDDEFMSADEKEIKTLMGMILRQKLISRESNKTDENQK